MCDVCETKKQLLVKEIPDFCFGQEVGTEELQVIVDRGYLRLGYSNDMQCMDHGEKAKINFCPNCGENLTHTF